MALRLALLTYLAQQRAGQELAKNMWDNTA